MRFDTPINVAELPQSDSNYDPIPAGWYPAVIKEAELKDTKTGTGQLIKVRYDVVGENHAGRVVFGNLNIRNANPKAEEIGRQQLGELLRAIGLATATDTDQLVGGSLSIKVAIREASGGYEAQNEVKGFKALSGAVPAPSKSVAPKPASSSKAPWEAASPF